MSQLLLILNNLSTLYAMCVRIILQAICLYTHAVYPVKKKKRNKTIFEQLKPEHTLAAVPLEGPQLFCKCISHLSFCILTVFEIFTMQIANESWEPLILKVLHKCKLVLLELSYTCLSFQTGLGEMKTPLAKRF